MAGNDNNAQMKVELSLEDNSLQALQKQLRQLENEAGKFFEDRKRARNKKGPFSAEFLVTDEQYKQTVGNLQNVRKAIADHHERTKPILAKAGGMFYKLMYGENANIQSPEDVDRHHKKLEQAQSRHISFFQRQLHSTLALSSAISSALSPLPGGQALHAGVAGFASGVANGMYNPATGQRRSGLSAILGGVIGGAKGAAANLIPTLLSKAVGGAIEGTRRDEGTLFGLAQAAGGDVRAGRAGLRAAYRAPGMTVEEASPLISGAFRAGGGVQSAQAVMRAQLTAGLGGEFTQLLGGLARAGGGSSDQGKLDSNAKKLWIDVLATGTATGLQKGRIGELIVGAQQMAGRQALGVGMGDPGEIFRLAAFLGQDKNLKGGAGFQMMGSLDAMAKGETSPMARALGLVRNGVGSVGLVESMRRTEQGIFGEGNSKGSIETIREMVQQVIKMAGGDRDMASLTLSRVGGMGINAATSAVDLVNSNKFGQQEFEALREQSKTTEQKAYESMISASGDWKSIDKRLQGIASTLGSIFTRLGGFEGVKAVLDETLLLLRKLNAFIDNWQKGGAVGAVGSLMGKTDVTKLPGYVGSMDQVYGKDVTSTQASKLAEFKASMAPDIRATLLEAVTRMRDAGESVGTSRQRLRQDDKGEYHFLIELMSEQGKLIHVQEVRQRGSGGPPQVNMRRQ